VPVASAAAAVANTSMFFMMILDQVLPGQSRGGSRMVA
jgi:hypothetical protein